MEVYFLLCPLYRASIKKGYTVYCTDPQLYGYRQTYTVWRDYKYFTTSQTYDKILN